MKAVAIYSRSKEYVPTPEKIDRLLAYLELMRVIQPGQGLERVCGEMAHNLGVTVISNPANLTVHMAEDVASPEDVDDLEDWVQIISQRKFHIWVADASHEIEKDNPTKAAMEKILGTEIDYIYCAS